MVCGTLHYIMQLDLQFVLAMPTQGLRYNARFRVQATGQ